eukprot:448159-Rhodomonas_salina.3
MKDAWCCASLDSHVTDTEKVPAGCTVQRCADGHGQALTDCDAIASSECTASGQAHCRFMQSTYEAMGYTKCVADADCCDKYDTAMTVIKSDVGGWMSTCDLGECSSSSSLRVEWVFSVVMLAAGLYHASRS